MVRYAKPPILDRIGAGSCVIEASAGTGKTYTLEHLIIQLIFDGVALENILVVTFSKKAALELTTRVRAKIAELLALEADQLNGSDPVWELTAERLTLLREALLGFDRATIATIHRFCMEVLGDAAFEGGHLFQQEAVAADRAFDRAFTTVLRKDYAAGQAGLLKLALADGGLDKLRGLLRAALKEADCLDLPAFRDPRSCLEAFPLALAQAYQANDPAIRAGFPEKNQKKITSRIDELLARREAALASAQPESFWADPAWSKTLLDSLEVIRVPGQDGDAARLAQAIAELANFDAILVAAFLPALVRELRRYKAEEGLYDFDDMIGLVAQALAGPQAEPLLARLRERYQVALIDEFQDTDRQQWAIFRRIFLGVPGHRLFLVGDPKQAIFGFRGGDLPTYVEALASMRAHTGAEPLLLNANHRSTQRVIDGYNAILDPAGVPPFFSPANARHYRRPVTCGKPALALADAAGQDLPAIRLVPATPLGSARQVNLAMAARLAQVIGDSLARGRFNASKRPSRTLRPEDVFVLTRSAKEGKLIGRALKAAGIPCALYRQNGLFDGPEAAACRDILLAIDAPLDACRRAKALLGPFFGLSLGEAERARDLPEGHPILARLFHWRDLAVQGRTGEFFAALVAESGLSQRLLFLHPDRRSLTNLLHILELLQQEALAGQRTLLDLAVQVQRWIADQDRPAVEDGDTQRIEGTGGAVQLLTMHKSKGLQAPVVALFGGTSKAPASVVSRYHQGDHGPRRAWVGPVKAAPVEVQGWIEREEAEEGERLEYVALTRAEAQLILPQYQAGSAEEPVPARGNFEPDGTPKAGPYRCVNQRLQALAKLASAERPAGMEAFLAEPDGGLEAPGAAWTPVLPGPLAAPDFQTLRRLARPAWIFNYTGLKEGLKHAEGGRDEEAKEHPLAGGPRGGKKLGIKVHALLQHVDPASFQDLDFEAWRALPETAKLARGILPQEGREEALRWVHQAMTLPLTVAGGATVVLAEAEELLRELDFLTPYPERADFLDGSMDVLFQARGRAFVLDWKTDRLAGYGPEHLDAAVQARYLLQLKIYSVTACRFLGITDEAHYERAFGGALYVFLRGLPEGGVWNGRPSWATLRSWERDLDALRPERFIPVHAGGDAHA